MFMNTSLAHYQLPLFGLNSMSLATEIGADQRSIFLRPITSAGEKASETWPITVEVKQSNMVPEEYRNWLARVTNYQRASGGSATPQPAATYGDEPAAPASGQAPGAQPPDAAPETPAAGPQGGSEGGADDGETGTIAPPPPPPQQPAPTDGGATESGGSQGGSGGLLGFLLR